MSFKSLFLAASAVASPTGPKKGAASRTWLEWEFKQRDVKDEIDTGVSIEPWGPDWAIVATGIHKDGGQPRLQRWTFEYQDQYWTTNQENWCSAGDMAVPSVNNGGRWERSYGCTFNC